jgi:histone acetyltransferase (RNA polymerase elongator complex component)
LQKDCSMRHYNIPVFIPGLACPHQCVFCDQRQISGQGDIPSPGAVRKVVDAHLRTFPAGARRVEIAFFGGSFTGLPVNMQQQYLEVAAGYVEAGQADGIRLSTRPDYIHPDGLMLLQQYGVGCVELGAQSLDEEVLALSGRGHSVADVHRSAAMIREAGMELGLQMMTGLPGDSFEKTKHTAREIVKLGAGNTRIYPTLVIRGTPLERQFREGAYQPLSLEEAIARSAWLLDHFETHGVKVLRLGLHPSHELQHAGGLVAGPWHPALKELALTRLWQQALLPLLEQPPGGCIRISVAPPQLNAATGYQAANKKMLQQHFRKVVFAADPALEGRRYHADPC